ncbi:MAG: PQQ-dependent sugar dehydrogenase [Chitinophagales bacterium]|nr:PQQ-dependent sugar dehydrogenase [Bacteroidota bacterium]
MQFKNYILSLFLLFCISSFAQPKIKLDTFTSSVPKVIDIANDGFTSRLFIADQSGRIFVYDSNGVKLDTFINIQSKVQFNGEEGLLGLTFHPNYKNNGYFYVYYTKKNSTDNAVFRYKVSGNPNRANSDSELLVINLPHPTFTNHNGGCIKFGNDGYLYISVGDGGSGNDPNNNAQNKNTILGKMLRIDVNDFDTTYTIPTSNPFYSQTNVRKEIWAYGIRNGWRFSFDRQTNDLWLADVGQSALEEVNFQAANSTGGENYGWRCYEGNNPNILTGCGNASNYVFPIFQYDHSTNGGIAITGGFVYRGNKYKDLQGYYLCADYASDNFWAIKKDGNIFNSTALGKPLSGITISSFGEDIRGELYVTNISNGIIYKIRELCSPFAIQFSDIKQPTCNNATNGSLQIISTNSNGNVQYNWNNGNSGNTINNLAAGQYIVTATDDLGCIRKDSILLSALDSLHIDANLEHPSCSGKQNGSITLTISGGTEPYNIHWSNGKLGLFIDSLSAGAYTVNIIDSNLCSTVRVFNLIDADSIEKPVITISSDTLNTDSSFMFYQWKKNNEVIIGATQYFYIVHEDGNYQVEITDINGCKATSETLPILTNIKNENSSIKHFSLYPNPTSNTLNVDIRFYESKKVLIKIINSIGQVISSTQINGKEISKTISLQHLPNGIYQVSIFTDEVQLSSKTFIKN